MSDQPLANEPAARTETGEIKDQTQAVVAETKPEPTTTPETKAQETKPDTKVETKDAKSLLNKDDKSAAVPDKYDFKVPEGYTLDEAVSTEASKLFKDAGLSQATAQSLVDFYIAKTQEAAAAPYKAFTEMKEQWRKDLEGDSQVGHRLNEVKVNFSRALDSLGDPKLAAEFREIMDFTGAGDHPAFARVIDKWTQRLTEGKSVTGGVAAVRAPGQGPTSAARALYPNLPSSSQ